MTLAVVLGVGGATAAAVPRADAGLTAATAPAVRDVVLTELPGRRFTATTEWGGRTTTPAGEPVTVNISDSYPQDPALLARWAAFLGSLVHGRELSTVTVFIARPREVGRTCGFDAVACYSTRQRTVVAPGEDLPDGLTAEAVLAHEYGHHVAASRANPPWESVDVGTKRWASYEQVCRGVQSGRLFPGDQDDPRRYAFNPGEAFAETYRVLNERRLGRAETPWDIVSEELYPDDGALAALEQDIRNPWQGPTTATVAGSFTSRGLNVRTHAVATSLDGQLRVTLRAPASARLRLEVLTASGGRVGTATVLGGSRTVRGTICGSRSHRLRVSRLSGSGAYRLTISKP